MIAKKTLSNREIYRAIALEYKQPHAVTIVLLAQLGSGIFYPLDLEGESRNRSKNSFVSILKRWASASRESLT